MNLWRKQNYVEFVNLVPLFQQCTPNVCMVNNFGELFPFDMFSFWDPKLNPLIITPPKII